MSYIKPIYFVLTLCLFSLIFQGCYKNDAPLSKDPLTIQPYDGDEELSSIKKMGKHIDGTFFMMKMGKDRYEFDSTTQMGIYFEHYNFDPPITIGSISTPVGGLSAGDSLFVGGGQHAFFYMEKPNYYYEGEVMITVTYRSENIVEGWFKGQAYKKGYLSTEAMATLPTVGAFRIKIVSLF